VAVSTLPRTVPPTPQAPPSQSRFSLAPWVLPTMVFLAAVAVAWHLHARFLEVHRSLWTVSTHDRNAHYLYSLKLANHFTRGEVFSLADQLNRARVWPPLYDVLSAGMLVVGGFDYRLAVLPSLAGWVGMVVLGFLVARRAAPRYGDLAGLTAAAFLLASPAYKAYATDIMLESLGACLTLAVLYAYLVTVQARTPTKWPARFLGLMLTLLFVEKYNYWLLVLLAVVAAEFVARPGTYLWYAWNGFVRVDWSAWARAQLRHPVSWLFAILLGLTAFVYFRGNEPLVVGGHSLRIYPPHNLFHAAYVVFFVRLVLWWRNGLGEWVRSFPVAFRQVILCHAWPVAVWFLLPKHPGYFLWYLSLGNAAPHQQLGLWAGLRDYGTWAVRDYHTGVWMAGLAGLLCVAGFVFWRSRRNGGHVVLLLLVIAAALTVAHPNRKSRNLHSWLAAGWVTAGLGLAALLRQASRRAPRARRWLAGATAIGLGCALLPALGSEAHAPEGGTHAQQPGMLDLTDFYLADLEGSQRYTVLAAVPVQPLVQWTVLERYRTLDRLEEHWYGFGSPGKENRARFRAWLKTTKCDTLVFFDRLPGPYYWEDVPQVALHAELRDVLTEQDVFTLVKEKTFPRHGCRVTLWRKEPTTEAQRTQSRPTQRTKEKKK
jgi:hypothetical protein